MTSMREPSAAGRAGTGRTPHDVSPGAQGGHPSTTGADTAPSRPPPPAPAGRVVDVEDLVVARKRVVRGVGPARVVVGATVGVSVIGTRAVLFPEFDTGTVGTVAFIVGMTAAIVGVDRFVRRLRHGSRAVAVLVLVAVAASLVSIVSGSLVVGFWAGFGSGALKFVVDPFTPGPATAGILAAMLVLLPMLAGGRLFGRMRASRRRIVRSRFLRWPIMALVATGLALLVLAPAGGLLTAVYPVGAVGVAVATPLLVLAARSAVEVLAPAAGVRHADDGVTAWPSAPVRRRRVLTGRRVVVVLPLVAATVVLVVVAWFVSRSVEVALAELVASPATTSRSAVSGLETMLMVGRFGLLTVALVLLTLARRLAALDGVRQRVVDQRPWLLYLRSFADDDAKVVTRGSSRHTVVERALLRVRERFEVVITWHLWRHGPVVGVGRPRERLPRLGAAREYLDDGAWRAGVERFLAGARAVVVVLGHSDGLAWELEAVRRTGVMDRTVLLVPPIPALELPGRWAGRTSELGCSRPAPRSGTSTRWWMTEKHRLTTSAFTRHID